MIGVGRDVATGGALLAAPGGPQGHNGLMGCRLSASGRPVDASVAPTGGSRLASDTDGFLYCPQERIEVVVTVVTDVVDEERRRAADAATGPAKKILTHPRLVDAVGEVSGDTLRVESERRRV